MKNELIILWMIFCHIIADYNLQGWLASAKTKYYWKKNAPDPMYALDYGCALLMHSFAWSFMIMLPIMIANNFVIDLAFTITLVANLCMHMYVDDLKANKKRINLWVDQLIHIMQIVVTSWILVGF